MRRFFIAVIFLLMTAIATPSLGAVSPLMSFQGVARDAGGNVVADGTYAFHFRIYNDSAAGDLYWEEEQNVAVTGGLFSVLLGAVNPLVDSVFQEAVWLEVEFSGTILPRIPITSTGYSYRVSSVDGSTGGVVTGSVDIGSGHNSLGTDHFVAGSTHLFMGEFSAITGGLNDTVEADYAFIGGGNGNAATGSYSSIGGGLQNQALSEAATVAGGEYNQAAGAAFVGGGSNNQAGLGAAVVGGLSNKATGVQSVAGGGHGNDAAAIGATVAGGFWNRALGEYSVVCGGGGLVREDSNTALGNYSFVGAGSSNFASGSYSFVGGGRYNIASGNKSVVCGGGVNVSPSPNVASGSASFVGAGYNNKATGEMSVVCGGGYAGIGDTNLAAGQASFVGAGRANHASGNCSAIPGGYYNDATGERSFAAGSYAKARHGYSFVWGDGGSFADSVRSDINNQFKIRAENGVCFASEAGSAKTIAMGDHYLDNGIIAWARISAAGSMGTTEFGVASCVPGAAGVYLITLDASAASLTQLIATATAEVDAQPLNATSLRIASINQTSANSFYVYINNGAGTAVDNDFVFTVTGR